MRKFLIIIIITFVSINAFTQNKKSYLRNGNKLYNDSSYNDAEMQYRKSLEKDQNYFNATFNLANAVYKQERYDEASALFNALSNDENNQYNKAKVYHNLGNTLFKEKKIEDAISAYKNALRLNPDDDDTRYNLALSTQEKRKQEQNKQEQDKQEQEKQEQDKQEQDKQEQDKQEQDKQEQDKQEQDKQEQDKQEQDKQEQMSKETAEKMLEAIQEQEKDLQEKLQKKKFKGKKQTILKDW